MARHAFSIRWAILAGLLFFMVTGCGMTRDVVRKVTPGHRSLKKRVMVAPFLDNAQLGPARTASISDDFRIHLEDSPHVLLQRAPAELGWPPGARSPELGLVVPQPFIDAADEKDMNALITGVINPLEISSRKGGVWPFRKAIQQYEFSFVVLVLDLSTNALLVSQLDSADFSIEMEDLSQIDEQKWVNERLRQQAAKLLRDQAKEVSKILRDTPFTGRILSVSGQTLTINLGQDVGLRTGERFEVLGPGETMETRGGQTVTLAGPRIGQIEVLQVGPSSAEAQVVEGNGPFEARLPVRFLP